MMPFFFFLLQSRNPICTYSWKADSLTGELPWLEPSFLSFDFLMTEHHGEGDEGIGLISLLRAEKGVDVHLGV